MNRFLKECKTLMTQLNEPCCFILGNDSCDLDSAISSICLAYFYHVRPDLLPSVVTKSNATRIVPLFNITRNILPLKTEVTYYLQKHEIELENICCRDPSIDEIIERSQLILVDHHVQNRFRNQIVQVIDHRPFDVHAGLPDHCMINVQEVGSCATLIADFIWKHANIQPNIQIELAQMLLGPIVLDTINFAPELDKVRPLDIEIAEQLKSILPAADTQKLFWELIKARMDIRGLNALQLLSKDLKIISNDDGTSCVAMPGYPILVEDFIKLPEAREHIEQFANEKNCDVIVMMGVIITKNENVHRDLAVINIKNSRLKSLVLKELLRSDSHIDLRLIERTDVDFLGGCFFRQDNTLASRKQILPIVQSVLNQFCLS